MKAIKMILMSLLFGLFLFQGTNMYAQDPLKVGSNVYKKVLFENDKVRVLEVVFNPGDDTGWHSHPDHVIYAESGGKIEITDKGKPTQTLDVIAGSSMFIPAVTHTAKNVGTTTMKLIVTEIKMPTATMGSKTTIITTVK
ncbi:MAG TPA: cupin domain-containing protein [Flavobacterium sp.]